MYPLSRLRPLLIILFLIFSSGSLMAETAKNYKEITAPETKQLMDRNPDVLLINNLSDLEFELQHLPGSISIPINTIKTTKLLPVNKKTPIIFYCMEKR